MGRVAMSVVVAGIEPVLLLGYLLLLPVSTAWVGRVGGALVSVLFPVLAIYLPSVVVTASGKFSPRWAGLAATVGMAAGAGIGIWLGFRVLAATDSGLLGEASVVVITLVAAALGSFTAALASIRRLATSQQP
jgi:hypothetical protein